MVPSQSFPQTIVINEAAPNNVTAVGSLSEGATIVQPADQSSGVLALPRGAGVTTYQDEFVRGRISWWNVSAQKALGTRMSATVATWPIVRTACSATATSITARLAAARSVNRSSRSASIRR